MRRLHFENAPALISLTSAPSKIEDLNDENAISYKKYKVRFEKKPDTNTFTELKNIEVASSNNNEIIFAVTGSVDTFVKVISQYKVLDLDEQETSLEDVFMQYYAKSSDNAE